MFPYVLLVLGSCPLRPGIVSQPERRSATVRISRGPEQMITPEKKKHGLSLQKDLVGLMSPVC